MLLIILILLVGLAVYFYFDIQRNYRIHELIAGDIFSDISNYVSMSRFAQFRVDGKYLNPRKEFCGVVCGNSMKPKNLLPGDMVIGRYVKNVAELNDLEKGRLIAIKITDEKSHNKGKLKIRELVSVKQDGELETISYNEDGSVHNSKPHYARNVVAIIEKVVN